MLSFFAAVLPSGANAPLPPEAAYAVLQVRDARFDGRILLA